MSAYIPLDRVAERLNVSAEKLWEMQGFGWISIVEKNGRVFIPEHLEYKAKFILRLQQVLRFTPSEISEVLLAGDPSYSLSDASRILAESRTEEGNAEVWHFHEGAD
jgi:hypothetical protein